MLNMSHYLARAITNSVLINYEEIFKNLKKNKTMLSYPNLMLSVIRYFFQRE